MSKPGLGYILKESNLKMSKTNFIIDASNDENSNKAEDLDSFESNSESQVGSLGFSLGFLFFSSSNQTLVFRFLFAAAELFLF